MDLPDLTRFRQTGIISPAAMRVVERNARSLGVADAQMMEAAGKALADAVIRYSPRNVLVLCGKGNNGGDGMVAARYLQHAADVHVCYHDDPLMSPQTCAQVRVLRSCRLTCHPVQCAGDVDALAPLFTEADLILDALLGTGSLGDPREPIRSAIRLANQAAARVVAADLPTPGMRADLIVAFHRPKCEVAEVVEIGIPFEAECCVGPGDLTLLPRLKPSARKGEGGRVLVVGGGPYHGAPVLAGLAALRAGADLVRVASPAAVPPVDLIHEHLPGERVGDQHLELLTGLAEWADVVVCGNGIGRLSHSTVTSLATSCKRAVFDADALRRPLPVADETIYTPHAGEFTRMTGIDLPLQLAKRGDVVRDAAGPGCILLKGQVDVISDGVRVRFNTAGCPAMAVGGTGDILAGVTGALFCRLPAFEASCIAAFVTGVAGTEVAARFGEGLLASDLLTAVPHALYFEE